MGAKAKTAIEAAQRAIVLMRGQIPLLVTDYQNIRAKLKKQKDNLNDIRELMTKKHPGVQDVSSVAASDKEIAGCLRSKETIDVDLPKLRLAIKANATMMEKHMESARTAIQNLTNLIIAKKAKREATETKAPIKILAPAAKVVAKLQTKSLGDLEDQKNAVQAVITLVHDQVDAILDYANDL